MELKPISEFKTCCSENKTKFFTNNTLKPKKIKPVELIIFIAAIVVWWLVYNNLLPAARYITYELFALTNGSKFAAAAEFFIYDMPKVLMLLTIVVFGVGILNSYFTPERTRLILLGKRQMVGNVLASVLGIATPFCTCSAIPLFIGFMKAGIPLGVTLSFLISAPMVNEVAVVLLYGLLGWKVALIYMCTGLLIAILAGWIIGRMKMEKYVEEWVDQSRTSDSSGTPDAIISLRDRAICGLYAVRDVVGKVWIWIVIGIAAGAFIHGYVPESFLASIMGKRAWWSVPIAVLIGIPIYSGAAGMIPIVQALLGKGAAIGTVLAFMMSVIALSLPEMIILRKVLKVRLLSTFVAVVGIGILIVGYLFNFII